MALRRSCPEIGNQPFFAKISPKRALLHTFRASGFVAFYSGSNPDSTGLPTKHKINVFCGKIEHSPRPNMNQRNKQCLCGFHI